MKRARRITPSVMTKMRHRRRWAGTGVLLLALAGLSTIGPEHAFADASAPPNFPTNCPPAQFPPAGYFNPTPGQPTPPAGYTGPPYHGPIPYEVPFKAIIYGGQITLGGRNPNTPSVLVPHLFASVCGTVTLPSLVGLVPASDINLATPNIYVGAGVPGTSGFKALEAIPASVKFGNLVATLYQQPASNGGLDAKLTGQTVAAVNNLGMSCSITLDANFTTRQSGPLQGQPVTGPTKSGQAEVVSDNFAVPAVVGSTDPASPDSLCPPPIAATFNKLLGLPAPAGSASFIAPFCFDFELEGTNNPAAFSGLNKNCPWPAH
jgi:hypothetical protein